jgi:ABC-type dipeptide/oligopeptide/nickel transport system ATPase component
MIKKNLDNIKSRMKTRNLDWVWLNVGEEGSGKSSFSIQLAQAFDEDFTADQIAFSGQEYMKKATELEPYSVMVLDEGIESLFSRNAMKK